MNLVNKEYKKIANEILNNGNIIEGKRAKWSDGIPADTLSTFATVTRYDLSEGLPILSLRNQYWKSAIKELLWIWVQNSNNTNDLGTKIWDQWSNKDGSIGKAYGYTLGKLHDFPEGRMTQVERLIYLLENNPTSRRMVVSLWDTEDLKDMSLTPCAHTITFSVIGGKLNAILDQRSGDFLAASGPGGYNEIQYSTLVYMLAHVTGLEVGEFVHIVADHHIYDRHIPYVKELINLESNETILPKLVINPYTANFKDFTIEDFKLEGYKPITKSRKMEVAI